MTEPHSYPSQRGFTLIESVLMIVAIVVFGMVVFAVVKKDYLDPQAPAAPQAPLTNP